MNTRLKSEDKELERLEKLIRETPVEVDLVNRTMSKYEDNCMSKQSASFKTHKKMRQRVIMMTVSAAILFGLIFVTSLISPTMAATIKQVPVLSSIFELAGDLGLKAADDKGLSTKLHTSATQDGFTLNVSEVVYDGTRVSIGMERLQTEGEFSKETLSDRISDIELFIDGNPINSFAPNDSNSIDVFMHPGKDKASVIVEFSDRSNQGGNSFPEQFDLTLATTISGIDNPLNINIPVKNKIEDYVTLQPKVSRQYENIHFTVEQIKLTPITTGITTKMVLTDNTTFTLPLTTMGIDVLDDQGRQLKLINGNGWTPSNGSTKVTDYRYIPFDSIPKTITIKPYIHLFDEKEMGAFQMDENNEPKIQYIPELEITLPINSQK
ncbi:DUF4179 domain-containing protein [Ureibacillus sinduriensis]|uniref:DUF4179 domain-containing protein n=1 Tax=Ureibacillus sinduriensis BLB-1 = JCM 15800 TaxID=1384057 RepID=A0A0A3HVD1_9BACL|nr:DUF4179 domain-containing protein [Ureibacillus sinduriensis]KGR76384.1 hypothetical protein CD33_07545 [Ureibacillus sinduriensis BLB-1 = JCM 15800]